MPLDHSAPPLPGPPPPAYTTRLPSLCMYAYAPEWPEVLLAQIAGPRPVPPVFRYATRLPSVCMVSVTAELLRLRPGMRNWPDCMVVPDADGATEATTFTSAALTYARRWLKRIG